MLDAQHDPTDGTDATAKVTRPKQQQYISMQEMMDDLDVGIGAIYAALRQGRLRGMRISTRSGWRVTRQDYEAWKHSLLNRQEG